MTELTDIKRRLRREAAEGDADGFRTTLEAFLDANSDAQAIQFAANRIAQFQERTAPTPFRLSLLSSFTLEPVEPALRVSEFRAGRFVEPTFIAYEQWAMALSEPGILDAAAPDAVLLLLHLEDVAPLLARQHLAADIDALDRETDDLVGLILNGLEAFRSRSAAPLILSSFTAAERGVERHFDRRVEPSRAARIDTLNQRLSETARSVPNVYVFDYAETVHDYGRKAWFDPVGHHHTHCAVSPRALPLLAGELSFFLSALTGKRRKVLALDLDNTLWGGVVGEDGPDGVAAGGDWPGNAFRDFQAFARNLRASGVALTLLSKNNEADVREGFEVNNRMPLSLDDFAAMRIDWNDKPGNLRAVADEIGLSPDTFVFADDNPLEAELMRDQMPEVRTVHLEGPASLFTQSVLRQGEFFCVGLTDEDRIRADSYSAARARNREEARTTDHRAFLAGLELELEFRRPKTSEIERITQLFARTNQFNLTTRRYSAADILDLLVKDTADLRIAKLCDRFGDYGIIGVTLCIDDATDRTRRIDSFLMSCRVLGRQVEYAMLATLENAARDAGMQRLIGEYVPSRKNRMVKEFYSEHGFEQGGHDGHFLRDLTMCQPLGVPDWISVSG